MEAVNAKRRQIEEQQAKKRELAARATERQEREFNAAAAAAALQRNANSGFPSPVTSTRANIAEFQKWQAAQRPSGRVGPIAPQLVETHTLDANPWAATLRSEFPTSNQEAMNPFGKPSRRYTHLNPNGQGETTPPAGAFGPPGLSEPTPAARTAAAALGAATTAAVEPQRPRGPVPVEAARTDPVGPDPRINALIAQVRELQGRPVVDPRRLADLEAELRRLQNAAGRGSANQGELNSVRTNLERLRGQLQGAQGDIAGLGSSVRATQRNIGALRIDVDGARADARRQIDALADEVRRLAEAQRAAASQAATAAAPAAAALQGTGSEASQITVVTSATADQSLAAIERIVANHEQTIRALNAEQAQLVAEMNRAAQNSNRGIAANAARSSEAAAARTADAIRASAAETTRQIEVVVAGFRDALGPISATLSGLPAMIASIQASGGTNDTQIAELIRQNGELQRSTGNLEGRVGALERQITETTERLRSELQAQKVELKADITELRAQLAAKGTSTSTSTSNTSQILGALQEVMKTHTDGLKDIVAALKPGPINITTGTSAGMNAKAELIELGAAREKLKELNSLRARLAALEKAKANAPTLDAKNAITETITIVKEDISAATGANAVTGATGATKKNTTKGCKYGWRNVSCGPGKPCNKHRINCRSRLGGRRRTRHKNNSNKRKHKTHKRGRR